MKGYHTIIEISAPPDMVWEVLLDTESYPDWNPLVGKVYTDLIEDEEAEVYITPLRQRLKVQIVKREEGRELRWQGKLLSSKLICGEHYYLLEPIDYGQRTLLKHGEKFTGALSLLLPPFVLNKMEKAFEEHNQLLKTRVERFFTFDDEHPEEEETDERI